MKNKSVMSANSDRISMHNKKVLTLSDKMWTPSIVNASDTIMVVSSSIPSQNTNILFDNSDVSIVSELSFFLKMKLTG